MHPDRWKKIDAIYQAALEQPEEERSAFLRGACGGDEELLREVEEMLEAREKAGSFLVRPAAEQMGLAAGHEPKPTSLTGKRLGIYEAGEVIGTGGMGQVYRARDTRLRRDVAIKVLPDEFAHDAERLARFEREATLLASLNHPNVAAIYGLEEQEGTRFLVLELVEGQTLADRLKKGRVPLDETLDIICQIAEGLEAAHEKGIIHRDLKPANVNVTPKGKVKILDFGLAKLAPERVQGGESASAAATTETAEPMLTSPGTAVGTVAYMSPEQALGQELDARTDLFSLGVVLYEMATGVLPFRGSTSAATFDAILHKAPASPVHLNPDLPEGLERIIKKALEKDRNLRCQSASDMRADLQRLKRDSDEGRFAAVAGKDGGRGTAARRWKWIASAVAVAAVLALAGYWYFIPRAPALTEKDTIVLSDFDNKTGDSVFDDTLKQGLSVQLAQSPFLNLLSDRKVNETLKLMGRPAGDRLTPEVTHEVCQRTGSKAMLTGSIAGLGNQYVIGLKAVACDTGDVLAEAQEQAAGKEVVLKALDAAAISLRSKLGESLSSVQKYATPLQEATTPSLEALKAFSLGIKAAGKEGTAYLPLLRRAVDLDPNFAVAYSWIADYYLNLGQGGRGAEYSRKAYGLRKNVSERERFFIEAQYYVSARGELEKAVQTVELWQQTYPRDSLPVQMLGYISADLGNWEKAQEEFRKSMRLDPDWVGNYVCLGAAYAALNWLDEAEAVYKQAEERKLENAILLGNRYYFAFLKGDAAQMAHLVSAAMGKPGAEDLLLAAQAETQGWYGKLKNAHELTARAMDSALHNDAKEAAATYQAGAALREVEAGNREEARSDARAALKLAQNRDVRAMAALALAQAGDTPGAEKLAAELDQAFPLDTLVQRYWLPSIRAVFALEHRDPNRAIELLKMASTIELGAISQYAILMCPAYLRGEAYLMLHDGHRAAAEFQKFIDYRGLVANFISGALARLGLARAYAMQGDTAKTRAAYQEFLTLWKAADPDVPILKEAKAEYAKLQ